MFPSHRCQQRRRQFLHRAFWLGIAAPVVNTAATESEWPLWRAFSTGFIQSDGRVIEHSSEARTTSEGQAYALFFALVANDRERFRQVLEWTERHLASNDLHQHLPAWLWGKSALGRWQVLDTNSASDADLWIAYSLLEAGRLWGEPAYSDLGLALLARVQRMAVVSLPGFGAMLLPAPRGFAYSGGRWRVNPSYLVPQQLRRFAAVDAHGPWTSMATALPAILRSVSPLGIVPDWAQYSGGRWLPDIDSRAIGSYDAVRAYLWAGMMAEADPLRDSLIDAQRGLRARIAADGRLPERIDTKTGDITGNAPAAFSGALLPWLSALGDVDALNSQRARLATMRSGELYGDLRNYYDQALALFGTGWIEGRFRFDSQGRLLARWAV